MEKISVAIIAKNASSTLDRCLLSVQKISDDIHVVVDSSTTDDTEKIAKKYRGHVYSRPLKNFSDQRNYASSLCKYSWILSIDTDEWVSTELVSEILSCDLGQKEFTAYSVKRLNYIFGKPIYHTNWSPEDDKHIRLFNKDYAFWQGDVHEHIQTRGKVGSLQNLLHHEVYVSVEQFLDKTNKYTSFESSNSNPLLPMWKFIRHYFVFRGFLDGWHGLFLSYLMAIYGLEVNIKTWLKKK